MGRKGFSGPVGLLVIYGGLSLAAVLLAAIAAAPVVLSRLSCAVPAARWAGVGLGLCFAVWAVSPFLGAFPVPFVGIGMSPVLGGWLGIGLLAGLGRLSRFEQDSAPGTGAGDNGEATAG